VALNRFLGCACIFRCTLAAPLIPPIFLPPIRVSREETTLKLLNYDSEYDGECSNGRCGPSFLHWIPPDHLTASFNLNQLEPFTKTNLTLF